MGTTACEAQQQRQISERLSERGTAVQREERRSSKRHSSERGRAARVEKGCVTVEWRV